MRSITVDISNFLTLPSGIKISFRFTGFGSNHPHFMLSSSSVFCYINYGSASSTVIPLVCQHYPILLFQFVRHFVLHNLRVLHYLFTGSHYLRCILRSSCRSPFRPLLITLDRSALLVLWLMPTSCSSLLLCFVSNM